MTEDGWDVPDTEVWLYSLPEIQSKFRLML